MIDQALQKLIEWLQTASPAMWNTLIKQVYLEAYMRLVWVVALIIACIIVIKLIQWCKKQSWYDAPDDDEFIGIIGGIIIAVFGIAAFCDLISAIMWFINPEFYAIRWLVESFTGK